MTCKLHCTQNCLIGYGRLELNIKKVHVRTLNNKATAAHSDMQHICFFTANIYHFLTLGHHIYIHKLFCMCHYLDVNRENTKYLPIGVPLLILAARISNYMYYSYHFEYISM